MHTAPLHRTNLQIYQWDQIKLPALFKICRMYTKNIHNFSLTSLMYALVLLSFMWNMLIVLTILFTFKVTSKDSRVLKYQLYTELCIFKMICFKFEIVFTFHDRCGICIKLIIFKDVGSYVLRTFLDRSSISKIPVSYTHLTLPTICSV